MTDRWTNGLPELLTEPKRMVMGMGMIMGEEEGADWSVPGSVSDVSGL